MKIKRGDKVLIIAGKDKGRQGKILEADPKKKKVVVESLNLLVKHLRPKREGEKGQRVKFPAPISVAKVALICPKCGQRTRVGAKILADKSKARICKKCKQTI